MRHNLTKSKCEFSRNNFIRGKNCWKKKESMTHVIFSNALVKPFKQEQ